MIAGDVPFGAEAEEQRLHDRVAISQGRNDFPGGNRDGKIPRRKDSDHSRWLARRLNLDVGPDRGVFSPGIRNTSLASGCPIEHDLPAVAAATKKSKICPA